MRNNQILLIFSFVIAVYAIGVWLHIPYGGGHVYSDIVTVFQDRQPMLPKVQAPYIEVFFEYPVITALVFWAAGRFGMLLGGSDYWHVLNHYYFASVLLLFPFTLWTIWSIYRLIPQDRFSGRRLLIFGVVTPTFIFLLLQGWYVLGVATLLQSLVDYKAGRMHRSSLFIGISAAASLITAIPALAILFHMTSWRRRIKYVVIAISIYALVNLPFAILNFNNWLEFWKYHAGWYIEMSWLILFFDTFDLRAHLISPIVFLILVGFIFWIRRKARHQEDSMGFVKDAWLIAGAYLFSTYVYAPQMNLMLLPFFVMLPIIRWPGFIIFDGINAAIAIVGFSGTIQMFIPQFAIYQFTLASPIQWLAITRCFLLLGFVVTSALKFRKLETPI